jgi:hypothetical protein
MRCGFESFAVICSERFGIENQRGIGFGRVQKRSGCQCHIAAVEPDENTVNNGHSVGQDTAPIM